LGRPRRERALMFYQRLGFAHTGEEDDGELVMRLELEP
jgi:hypothetical protein